MRLFILTFLLFVNWSAPIFFATTSSQLIEQTAYDVVAWDTITLEDKQLLFTIEGDNNTVYSPHLKMQLKTGAVVKIYQIDSPENYLADAIEVDSALIKQLKLPCIYQNEMRSAHPWLITVGQSDFDEHIEVFVGAFRATKYYSDETRPYFLEYRDGVLVRRWTGSMLNCIAFSDAQYLDYDGDGRDELKVVEHNIRNGKSISEVGYYRLYGFIPHRLDFNR